MLRDLVPDNTAEINASLFLVVIMTVGAVFIHHLRHRISRSGGRRRTTETLNSRNQKHRAYPPTATRATGVFPILIVPKIRAHRVPEYAALKSLKQAEIAEGRFPPNPTARATGGDLHDER
jgi:hypothetical protein